MRVLTLGLAAALLSGCVSAGLIPDVAEMEFRPRISEAQMQAMRQLGPPEPRRPYDGGAYGDTTNELAALVLSADSDRNGYAADGRIRPEERLAFRERTLRTRIDAGEFQFLPEYWEGLHAQPGLGLTYFTILYAVPATRYVAEQFPTSRLGAWAQAQLAAYWTRGCSSSRMSRYAPQDDFGCKPRPDLVARYQAMLEANPAAAP